MTPTPVGMRCPECSKQRTRVMKMRNMARDRGSPFALIAINVIVFLTEQGSYAGGATTSQVNEEGRGPPPHGIPTLGVAHGQYWRLITSGFLHENLLHIGFNMYLLYLLGMMLEPALGRSSSPRSTSPRCWPAPSGRWSRAPVAEPRRLRRDFRADGRRRVELRAQET